MALLELSDGRPSPLPSGSDPMVGWWEGEEMEDVALEDSAGPSCVWISGLRGWTWLSDYKDPTLPPDILVSHHQVQRQHSVMKGSATVRPAEKYTMMTIDHRTPLTCNLDHSYYHNKEDNK